MHTNSQFINDKFLYNQSVAMEMLVRTGLKEQLFELAKVSVLVNVCVFVAKFGTVTHSLHFFPDKTHRRLHGSLEVLLQYGSSELEPSLQTALVNKQFTEALSTVANGKKKPHLQHSYSSTDDNFMLDWTALSSTMYFSVSFWWIYCYN